MTETAKRRSILLHVPCFTSLELRVLASYAHRIYLSSDAFRNIRRYFSITASKRYSTIKHATLRPRREICGTFYRNIFVSSSQIEHISVGNDRSSLPCVIIEITAENRSGNMGPSLFLLFRLLDSTLAYRAPRDRKSSIIFISVPLKYLSYA